MTSVQDSYTVLFLLAVIGLAQPEPQDINVIYRLHEPPPGQMMNLSNMDYYNSASLEYHGMGLILTTPDGLYADPNLGMPALGCVTVSQCSWQKSGWSPSQLDLSSVMAQQILNFRGDMSSELNLHRSTLDNSYFLKSIDHTLASDSCSVNNGGCLHTCTTQNYQIQCSCPEGYILQQDGQSCYGRDSTYKYVNGFRGMINIDGYYNGGCQYRRWLIVTPPNSNIQLNLTINRWENGMVVVYDGDSTSKNEILHYESRYTKAKVITSTNNKMFLYIRFCYSMNVEATFTAVYPALVLSEDTGTLISQPVLLSSNAVCVSVIYKLASYSSSKISVFTGLSNEQTLELTLSRLTELEDWRVGRFTSQLPQEYVGEQVTFSVFITGEDSAVYSIVGCNPNEEEDVLVLSDSVPANAIPIVHTTTTTTTTESTIDASYDPMGHAPLLLSEEYEDEPEQADSVSVLTADIPTVYPAAHGEGVKCHNGGVWNSTRQICFCPVGFIGKTCEEGCGANSYGINCRGNCSDFGRECKGMIFCRPNLPCTCAPGFSGPQCNIKCTSGQYGASCQNRCGHCNNGDCDPYTGSCPDICKPGFYPPLCQDSYKMLSVPPTLSNIDYTSATITAELSNVTTGRGTPRFYQLQYKQNISITWQKLQPLLITSSSIEDNLKDLKSGTHYLVRVILIDIDGNSYDKADVPTANLTTFCKVPDSSEYHVEVSNITSTSFDVTWEYKTESSIWCPIMEFEVFLQVPRRQLHHIQSPKNTKVSYTGLLSGENYEVMVRAVTERSKARFSQPLSVRTADKAPGFVRNIAVVQGQQRELKVSWIAPKFTGGNIRHYRVKYQCLRLLACQTICNSTGELEVNGTSVVLSDLLPHAQYIVKIAGQAATLGPYKAALASTKYEGATVAPDASPSPVLEVSNTSLTVQWMAPDNCLQLNGYLLGYRYELLDTSNKQIVQKGVTSDTNVTFSDLKPLTNYQVLVYIITSDEWNPNYKLVINATTSPTVPEKVQELTVYKKGRRTVGVRWAPPSQSYGDLKSFTVAYRKAEADKGTEVREIIAPVHCGAWPLLYCHSIKHLVPDTEYIVTVQARNSVVDTDGVSATVLVVTREGLPGAPENLRIFNHTQNSVVVEWQLPGIINGVLRSFLMSVEETDSVNASDCCTYYPLQELPVRSEDEIYNLEVNGLRPASTISISISAKTITIGPSATITAYTRPEVAVIDMPEIRLISSEDDLFSIQIIPSDEYPGLKSTYLLIIVPFGEAPEPTIWDEYLSRELKMAVGQNFYLVGEYQPEQLKNSNVVYFPSAMKTMNGTLAHLEVPNLETEEIFKIGIAHVLDYCGARSVSFLASDSFVGN